MPVPSLIDLLVACQLPVTAPLRLVRRPADDACAYGGAKGGAVIPSGRYPLCATGRFDRLALGGGRYDGGTHTLDAAWAAAPTTFRQHAAQIWQQHRDERLSE